MYGPKARCRWLVSPGHWAVRARVERLIGLVAGDVLDEEGDTGEGAAACGGGLGPGPFEAAMDDRVELRVERFDAGDRGVDQLQRLDLAGPDQGGEGRGVVITESIGHPRTVA